MALKNPKVYVPIIIGVILVVVIVAVLVFGKKKTPETLDCKNGGTYRDGKCICLSAYTGDTCNTLNANTLYKDIKVEKTVRYGSEMCWQEIEIIKNGTNVALTATATSSEPYSTSYPATRVNDGVSDNAGAFFHAKNDGQPQWVNLSLTQAIAAPFTVKLYNRNTALSQNRANGATVKLYDNNGQLARLLPQITTNEAIYTLEVTS
jgi:hypothetical protein